MTKEQFIMELEQCLQGEVSAYELSDSLTYYRQYFEDEIRNGKSEEQVVEELEVQDLLPALLLMRTE